jgi:serine/threonine protein kinase/Tfp pilus assembly protein PilF
MSDPGTVEELVKQAQALSPSERAGFIRRMCETDEWLMSQVLHALEHADQQTRSWATLPDDVDLEVTTDAALAGQRLGPYRFIRKLGSGGMGDVWLAERADEEYQQRVAIKLVRAGVFSAQVHSRLRMERQILASLQHPNIARLLDGGRASDGTPYLVLEYIDGEPIDVYCDRRRLGFEARIRLFQQICATVHYAHQNLIVHRDLKPNNILITQDGVPKLLDFGIAKLLDTRQAAGTLAVTHLGYRVMTPTHASPEQIRGEAITTASDIYVLGLLLYELLAGRKPFDFHGSTISEMERVVTEQDAPPPSAMLAQTTRSSPELIADIAACRSTTPARLEKELRGDLDNIVMMAMRKDAGRRYGSAEQLTADLDRHLQGLPVIATSDTWTYRARKFVTRHALPVIAATAAVAMLAVFATITFLQAQRIAKERDAATAERTRAEQISSFLVELFELSDPSKSRGNQVTARELLDIGARRVSVGLNDQPETRATLLETIGRVYKSLGLYSDSIALLENALESRIAVYGSKHIEVAAAMVSLGDALLEQGTFDRAQQLLDDALRMQQELAGSEAIETAPTLLSRAKLAQRRGELEHAQELFAQSIAIYRLHQQERTSAAASVVSELANLHSYRGAFAEAERLYRRALDIDRQALGRDHPQVAMHLHNLAVMAQMQGELAEAEPLYAESTELLRRILGETHPDTLDALSNYGRFLHRKGDLERAEAMLAQTVRANRTARGEKHAFIGHDLVSLAIVRLDRGAYETAEKDLRAALEIYREALPPEHPYVASALANVGRTQLERGDARAAEQTLRQAIDMALKFLPADSAQIAAANSSLGRALLATGKREEAERLLLTSLPILERAQGPEASITLRTREAVAQLQGK